MRKKLIFFFLKRALTAPHTLGLYISTAYTAGYIGGVYTGAYIDENKFEFDVDLLLNIGDKGV